MRIFALVLLALQLTVMSGMSFDTTDMVNHSNTVQSVPRPGCFPCDELR